MFKSLSVSAVAGFCLVPQAFPQTASRIDFARDVQPIFRQNCIGCHGPKVQNNGLRLDRKSSALKPGSRRVIPGSLQNSFLYHRIAGTDFGLQMPPTGPLKPEQIQIIKTWIEQGAEWPDSLSNEVELPPVNPKAVAMVEALRLGWQQFEKTAAADPALLNARGPEGSTPFMYAVLYRDAAALERLVKLGADPNKRNDAGATALMWAAVNLEKTRVLLAHGAEVNARSEDARTPLMIAAGRPGGAPIVKLLLDHGANPNPNTNPGAVSSPLLEASLAVDAESMRILLDHGAEVKDVGGTALANAAPDCAKCVDLLVARNLDKLQYTIALQQVVVLDNPKLTRLMLEHGADVNAVDPMGRTALMYAAVSDLLPVEQIRMLIEKEANVNTRSAHQQSGDTGRTALDLALLHGQTPVVDLLLKAGALKTDPAVSIQPVSGRAGNTIRAAVSASLPLLQRTDSSFVPKAGCFSCHNDSLAAMAVALARTNGFRVDEQMSALHVRINAGALTGARDHVHQGFLVPGINVTPIIAGYELLGLDAEGYKPDLTTDSVAMFIQQHQMADGHWAVLPESRPPLCSDLSQTVIAMRVLQLYAPPVEQATYAKSIQLAGKWIAGVQPRTNYDLAWRLQGLAWAAADKDAIRQARRDLLAVQHADGGWSDIPSMESGAFTTGLAMVALEKSGLPVSDKAYQRGIRYLLDTQLEDGSWHVRSRAAAIQPYFDNGFPHGVDQWISAAGTSWATMALALAGPSGDAHNTVAAAAR